MLSLTKAISSNVITIFLMFSLCSEVFSKPPSKDQLYQWKCISQRIDYQHLLEFINKLTNDDLPAYAWVNQVVSNDGRTMLHCAASQGHAPAVALLLSYGAYPNALTTTLYPESPLKEAVVSNHWTVVFLLIQNGAGFQNLATSRVRGRLEKTAIEQWLQRVHRYKHYQTQCYLSRLFARLCSGFRDLGDPYRETTLHSAVRFGIAGYVTDCLRRHPEHLSIQRADGCTPLHVAVIYRQHHILLLLLSVCCQHSPFLNYNLTRNKDNRTPLQLSEGSEFHPYLQAYHLAYSSPMHVAAMNGDVEVINFLSHELLTQGMVNYQRSDGATPLHCACLSSQGSAVAALLLLDADPSIKDQNNETPLDWAFECDDNSPDREEIIKWLSYFGTRFWILALLECSMRLSQ